MREVNLIGGFYQSKSLPFSAQDAVNWLPVKAQAEGARSPLKLRGAPGMVPLGEDVPPPAPPAWVINVETNLSLGPSYLLTSDPMDWTAPEIFPPTPPGPDSTVQVSAANGRFFLHDRTADDVYTSLNRGAAFSVGSMPPINPGGRQGKIVYALDRWVIPLGSSGVAASVGGIDFTPRSAVNAAWLHYSAGKLCALMVDDFDYRKTRYSTDSGLTWTESVNEIVTGTPQGWSGGSFIFGDSLRVMAAGHKTGSGNLLAYSDDGGVNWTLVSSPFSGAVRAVAGSCGGNVFVMVADDGSIARSVNRGVSWSIASGSLGVAGKDVAFASGVFVAVGASRVVKTSTDGNAWSSAPVVSGLLELTAVAAIP